MNSQPNVILIVIDCLRADHMGSYGYDRPTTPHLDRFAKNAVRFEHAVTQATWTLPSITTLITGLNPPTHKAVLPRVIIPPELQTITEVFREAGFKTGGFSTTNFASIEHNFAQGFDFFDESLIGIASREPTAQLVVEKAVDFIDRTSPNPFFLYLHFFDPHMKYDPPKKFRKRFGVRQIDLYDGEIAYVDDQLGKFFRWLKRRPIWKNSVVIITADHGEEFFEHAFGEHGSSVYQSLTHVPLIIRVPDGSAGVVETTVGLVDIAPTLAEIHNLPLNPQYEGRSLLSLIRNPATGKRGITPKNKPPDFQHAYLSITLDEVSGHNPTEVVALITDTWKLINDKKKQTIQLYYLPDDPNEQNDLASEYPDTTEYLLRELNDRIEQYRAKAESMNIADYRRVTNPAFIEHLKSLGYIQ